MRPDSIDVVIRQTASEFGGDIRPLRSGTLNDREPAPV
jgi:hypothetical protein